MFFHRWSDAVAVHPCSILGRYYTMLQSIVDNTVCCLSAPAIMVVCSVGLIAVCLDTGA